MMLKSIFILLCINRAVKAFNSGNYKNPSERNQYLHKSNIAIDEDSDDSDDDDPMDGSRGEKKDDPKENIRKINPSNFEAKCKYMQDKVITLQQVIAQDIAMIKSLAPRIIIILINTINRI